MTTMICFAEVNPEDNIVRVVHRVEKYDDEPLRLPNITLQGNVLVELATKPESRKYDSAHMVLVDGGVMWVDLADIEQIRTRKLTEINTACETTLAMIKASYPASEVLSWSVQETEARAYVLDDTKPIPFLTALADARGVTVPNLAALIIAKADAFAGISGSLIGKRQRLEKLAEQATTIEDIEVIAW